MNLKDYVLSELIHDMIYTFARGEPSVALAVDALQRFLAEHLGECPICGAIGNHGKDYDQFTDSESLAHRVEADAQFASYKGDPP